MLHSRRFKHNIGFQIDVDRLHPVAVWDLNENYNTNQYHYDPVTHTVSMAFNNVANAKGTMYGGSYGTQTGSGMVETIDTAKVALDAILKVGKVAASIYKSEPLNRVRNAIASKLTKNKNFRPGFAGELHLPGYNWAGPGTNVISRLERGDLGINALDNVAKVHDIDYQNANSWEDVRKADDKLIRNLENNPQIPRATKAIVKNMFKVKEFGEDHGLIPPDQFTSFPNIKGSGAQVQIHDGQNIGYIPKKGGSNMNAKRMRFRRKDPLRKLRQQFRKANKSKKNKLYDIAFRSIKKRLHS